MKRTAFLTLVTAALAGLLPGDGPAAAGGAGGRPAARPTAAVAERPPAPPPAAPPRRLVPAPSTAAGRPDPDHVLVRFRAGTDAEERAAVHRENRGRVAERLRPERVELVRIPRADTVQAALARYRDDPEVAFAEPNRRRSIVATPNDPLFKSATGGTDLWGLDNTGQGGGRVDADIDAPEAWDRLGLSGSPWPKESFAVGVIDTGVYAAHEDLTDKVVGCHDAILGADVLPAACVDDNGHGTHVAGTIAAVGNNGKGVVGAAPGAGIYSCKALAASGEGFESDVIECVNEIVERRDTHNIRAISMSLGSTESSLAEQAAIDHAWSNGVLVLAAAGNSGTTSGSTDPVVYPAGYAHAVSVGATDRADAHAGFSNENPDVELGAPGVGIVSTLPVLSPSEPTTSGYAVGSGTSMATPHAAAVAALIAHRTGRSGQALRDALDAAVDDLGPPGRDPSFGFGRVNACLALGGACAYGTPRAPTGMAATAGDGSVSLDWTDASEPYPVAYRVYRRNADGSWPTAPFATTSASSFTDAGLANGTAHTYRVTAYNQAAPGNESAPSSQVTAVPARPPKLNDRLPAGYRIVSGGVYRGRRALSRLFADDGRRLEVAARRRGRRYTSDLYAYTRLGAEELTFLRGLRVTYNGNLSSRAATLRLRVYHWRLRRWVSIFARRRVTRDRTVTWTSPAPRDYVSASGLVRLRITGTRSRGFRTRSDWVRFRVEH